MSESKSQNYLHGAAILAVGVVIMKILGFLYKMPIGNIIGDDGYSMFLATYNIYNVFLSLATAGLPIALSRLRRCQERHGQHRRAGALGQQHRSDRSDISCIYRLKCNDMPCRPFIR